MTLNLKYSIFSLLITFSIIACQKNHEKINFKYQPIKTSTENFNLNEKISSMSLLVFPESPSIGKIKNVFFSEENIFVVDGVHNDIKVYDKELKYKRTISAIGQGPGEYHSIFNAFLGEGDNINIFSHFDMSIFTFDINGNFKNKTRLDDRPFQVINLSEGYVGYMNFNSSNEDKPNLSIWSKSGKEKESAQHYDEKMITLIGYSGGISNSLTTNDEFYYHRPLSDSLHLMNEKLQITKTFTFDFLDNSWKSRLDEPSLRTDRRDEYGYIAGFSAATSNIIYVSYKEPPILKNGIMDLSKNLFYPSEKVSPRVLDYFIFNPKYQDGQGFIYSLPNYDFISMIGFQNPNSFKGLPESIRSEIENGATNENFKFLVKYRFK
jgi:hypothetical protein